MRSSSRRERSSGVNEVRKGRGVFIDTVKKLFARRFRTNVPLPFLLHATRVTHVLCNCDRVRSWVNRIMHHGIRNGLSGKTENLDKICFKVSFAISLADTNSVKILNEFQIERTRRICE